MRHWNEYEIEDIALEFGTDVNYGKANAKPGKKRKGDNNVFVLPEADTKTVFKQLSSDASLWLLAVTYIIAAFMGHLYESITGVCMILAMFVFAFCTKYSSAKRISNSYRMLLPVAKVVENGINIRLSILDVEVGDLICFSQGDIIPADARLVSSNALVVAERHINTATGKTEYIRMEKDPAVVMDDQADQPTYKNILYAGSMVISGKGRAIVTETGNNTRSSSLHSGIRLVQSNDAPSYFSQFCKSTKRVSLISFLSVIPLTLAGLVIQTLGQGTSERLDLMYLFLLMLSLSVTCMSELTVAPAETLVTKEILLSSRSRKAKRNTESRITKLSAAEELADTDTLLILNPEVLRDKRYLVRRVYFADKQYRFDTLRSEELRDFWAKIAPVSWFTNPKNMNAEMRAIKEFISDIIPHSEVDLNMVAPRFLKNYPITGSRACVFNTDSRGVPVQYVAHSSDPELISKCLYFRTEGGGRWKFDRKSYSEIMEQFHIYLKIGLAIQIFVSVDPVEEHLTFEGMVAVGYEYPFADGELSEELSVSGIQPILMLDSENDENTSFALQCGLINDLHEAAVASDYRRNGMLINDAPLNTKVYIGFGADAVADVIERLRRNGKNVLPIIKDSADRKKVAPLTVYATHVTDSYDSVRISSSLSLQAADATVREGGVFDCLKAIRGSSMARLKLGIYKNYLAFSVFLRTVAVCLPLIVGETSLLMSTLMILFSGFVCDMVALFTLMFAKGIPVKPQDAATDAGKLFSSSLFIFFSLAGSFVAVISITLCKVLISVDKLALSSAPQFIMFCVIAAQISALGGLLVMLNRHSRRASCNWIYLAFLGLFIIAIFVQSKLPVAFYIFANGMGIYLIRTDLLPYIIIVSALALATVLLISRLLSALPSRKKI